MSRPPRPTTPKISTGIDSGSTSTGSSRPPRRSVTASAAPITPMRVSAGVPASSVSATAQHRAAVEIEQQAEQRARRRSAAGRRRASARAPWRGQTSSSGVAAHHDQVERAVLVVGQEQPVERQQARQQRADPQDRRPEPRQQIEVGPDGERHQRDDAEEKQHADRGAAADPPARCGCRAEIRAASALMPRPRAAARARRCRAAGGSRRRSGRRRADVASSGAATSPGRRHRARWSARRAARPGVERDQARHRKPPALAGREEGCGQMAEMAKADRLERRGRARSAAVAAQKIATRMRRFPDRQRRLERVAMAERCACSASVSSSSPPVERDRA